MRGAALAGHRTTYGAPLFDIDKLRAGDQIIIRTLTKQRYVYIVTAPARVISRFDMGVIGTTDPSTAMLTLTSRVFFEEIRRWYRAASGLT